MDNWVYWTSFWSWRMASRLLYKAKFHGQNNFPEWGPALLISNHQSVLDPFLLAQGVAREIRWMSKKENWDIPLMRGILKFYGTFPLDRDNPQKGMDKAVELLKEGEVVGMFPEGTRSRDGKMASYFKTGAARIVLKAKVPYVPLCIIGSDTILPKGEVGLKFRPLEIRVGNPVFLDHHLWNSYTEEDIKKIAVDMWTKVHNLKIGEVDPVQKVIITADMPKAIRKAKIISEGLTIS
ncbi:MAG: lysophospholipid acyltransferase family protein [Promethearchaeota archaeon]